MKLAVLATFLVAFSAAAQSTTTQRSKKLIEFGWDEPDTAFMRAHIREMEKTPFDGTVFHLMYTKADGSRGSFMGECWSRRAFSDAELQAALDDLNATRFQKFTHN